MKVDGKRAKEREKETDDKIKENEKPIEREMTYNINIIIRLHAPYSLLNLRDPYTWIHIINKFAQPYKCNVCRFRVYLYFCFALSDNCYMKIGVPADNM